jgi:predicted CXXCH cytochrome family protein
MKRALALLAATVLALPGAAVAFHDGGVASCQGCHVVHQSDDGMYVPAAGTLLLEGSPTDVCLTCHHAANGSVFGFDPLAPHPEYGGGNFIFLLEDNLNDRQSGSPPPIAGEAAGHSIVAPGAGLFPDSRYASAPGGSFPTTMLGCTSCHDPHGNGNYRMLHGTGPVQDGLHHFMAPAPQAEGISPGAQAEGPTNHTAYHSGWSAWCGNCHGANYHAAGQGRFAHPVDLPLGSTISAWYAGYLGDANPIGGDPASSYLPQVPFEDPATTPSSTAGPTASSRVTCLSCHRAHGSSAPASGRWDWNLETLGGDGVASGSWPIPNPYADPAQRSLCVKCHEVSHDTGSGCVQCHASGSGGGGPQPTSN